MVRRCDKDCKTCLNAQFWYDKIWCCANQDILMAYWDMRDRREVFDRQGVSEVSMKQTPCPYYVRDKNKRYEEPK